MCHRHSRSLWCNLLRGRAASVTNLLVCESSYVVWDVFALWNGHNGWCLGDPDPLLQGWHCVVGHESSGVAFENHRQWVLLLAHMYFCFSCTPAKWFVFLLWYRYRRSYFCLLFIHIVIQFVIFCLCKVQTMSMFWRGLPFCVFLMSADDNQMAWRESLEVTNEVSAVPFSWILNALIAFWLVL